MPQRFYICVIVALALSVAFFAGRASGPSTASAAASARQATLNDVVTELKLISADDYQVTINTKQICKAIAGDKAKTLCK